MRRATINQWLSPDVDSRPRYRLPAVTDTRETMDVVARWACFEIAQVNSEIVNGLNRLGWPERGGFCAAWMARCALMRARVLGDRAPTAGGGCGGCHPATSHSLLENGYHAPWSFQALRPYPGGVSQQTSSAAPWRGGEPRRRPPRAGKHDPAHIHLPLERSTARHRDDTGSLLRQPACRRPVS